MSKRNEPSAEVAVRTVADTMAGLDLEMLEAVVDRNKQAVTETVLAIAEIRERKLYRESHSSFEEYALERFGISLSTAKRWAAQGAEIRKDLDAETNPQVSAGRARAIPSQREVERRRAVKARAPSKPIEAAATEVPRKTDVEPSKPETKSSAPPSPPVVERPTPTREEQVHALIDRFLQSDPGKVARLDDFDPALAVRRAERVVAWADRYLKAAKRLGAKGSSDPAKCQHPQSAHQRTEDGRMVRCGLCGESAFSAVSLSRKGERVG